jgi:soluble lytic murein transglycosylase-like protein
VAALKQFVGALLILSAAPASADPLDRWKVSIREAARKFGLPADWIRQVMRVESGGETMRGARPIVSPAGAIGLMQLMPGTWHDMQAALRLGSDPQEPAANIMAGACYLKLLYDRFGYPGMFAAYNAGPDRYRRYLVRGVPLPAETHAYLKRLMLKPRGTAITARPPMILLALASASQTPVVPVSAGQLSASSGDLFVPLNNAGGR